MSRIVANNTKTIAILASEAYLPQLRACITSIKKHFGLQVDINVAWFGDSMPMLPKGVFVHPAKSSEWAFPLGNTMEQVLGSRPAYIKFLMSKMHYHQVLHIGADVMFYSNSDWVFEAYKEADTAACPHSCAPYPNDGKKPNELQVHLTGHLNSDFVMYNAYKQTLDFLDFQIREHNKCFGNDPSQGYFYDQVWLAFLPYYTTCTLIKDPRINVAYYNLHERQVIRTEKDQYWVQIKELPNILYQLTCFQFTGYNPSHPDTLSKYNSRLDIVNPDVVKLCLEYQEKLEEAGWRLQQ